jgi:hypothetical protein
MSYQRELASYKARARKLSKTFTHADLTAATNGLHQDLSLGSLPLGAVVRGHAVKLTTYFTGGAATAVTLALGTGNAGDPDMLMTVLNVFDTTALNAWTKGAAGVLVPPAPLEGELFAQFDVDGAHTLLALTAGSVTIEVWYDIPEL